MCLKSVKCKIMHYGKKYLKREYYIDNVGTQVWLEMTEVEKDLGVMRGTASKWKQLCLRQTVHYAG